MKYRLKLIGLRAHKNRNLIFFTLTGFLTLLFMYSLLYTWTSNSIDSKNESTIQQAGKLNTTLGNIKISDDTTDAIKEISFYQNSLEEVKIISTDNVIYRPNVWEGLLHRVESKKLSTKGDRMEEFFANINEDTGFVEYELRTLTKFLNYSPEEDLALLGQDPIQDSERLERTKLGLKTLVEDNKLSLNNRKSVEDSLKALDMVKSTVDIPAFSTVIDESKSNILKDFRTRIQQIKSDSSEFYNYLLYQ